MVEGLIKHEAKWCTSVSDALTGLVSFTEQFKSKKMASEELVRGVVSASLLNPSWDDLTKFVENPDFDLGMGEWLSDPLPADFEGMSAWMSSLHDLSCITDMDDRIDENSSSAPKRSRLSLPKKGVPVFKEVGNCKPSTSRRFAQPVESPEREKAAKGVIPAKTAASMQWALKNFNDWAHNRSLWTLPKPFQAIF